MKMLAFLLAFVASACWADTVTDWNLKDGEFVTAANMPTPPANRAMAIAHTAAYEAANAIAHRYPAEQQRFEVASTASIDAAIAAAHRSAFEQLVPSQRAAIEAAYQAALARIADGTAKAAGIAAGEAAAAAVLQRRGDDGAALPEAYQPQTTPGRYVPTTVPAVPQWPQRKPWLMSGPAQFRPEPPPDLTSERWARDYNEIKAVGGRRSTLRTPEQTDIARFWETTLPPIYHGLVRCVAGQPGRDVLQNARLFALVTQATDDALIAVMDAKYHYAFWRPVTAIRNGDSDGNGATEPDRSWLPFVETPMHPEYPCAHCIQAATVATVLQAATAGDPQPTWATVSASANGTERTWPTLEAFVAEVSNARVYGGVHYRFSTEAGTAMGRKIGALAAAGLMAP
jgi:PAP2 superfamily